MGFPKPPGVDPVTTYAKKAARTVRKRLPSIPGSNLEERVAKKMMQKR